jgi:hypothetical protein
MGRPEKKWAILDPALIEPAAKKTTNSSGQPAEFLA